MRHAARRPAWSPPHGRRMVAPRTVANVKNREVGMDLQIKGRRAIVAGASAGLGYSSALALAREGVELLISARGEERLCAAAAKIKHETGALVNFVVADHGTREGREALLARCPEPDILVISCSPPKAVEEFHEITVDDWQASLSTTFVAPVELIKASMGGMVARRWGRIVNIATAAAKHPLEMRLLSGPSRAALVNCMAAISKSVAKDNVVINNLLPGLHATPGLRQMLADKAERAGTRYEHEERAFVDGLGIPTGRLADPDSFGAFCAMLCSAYASSVIGQSVVIDGGAIRTMF